MRYVLVFYFIGVTALAGNRVGNGGNVAVCESDGNITKIQLLDFFEKGGFDYDLKSFEKRGNGDAIVDQRLDVLSHLAPKLADQYRRRIRSISSEWNVKNDVALTEINDSLHAFAPAEKNCSVKQTVVRLPELEEGKRFLVNARYWARLTEAQRAGLKMHEMVYEHLNKLGASDSRNARKIVALMFSENFDKMKSGDFWLFIKNLKIPIYP